MIHNAVLTAAVLARMFANVTMVFNWNISKMVPNVFPIVCLDVEKEFVLSRTSAVAKMKHCSTNTILVVSFFLQIRDYKLNYSTKHPTLNTTQQTTFN